MTFLLKTSRLKMRAFRENDIPDFAAYRSDPEVAKYQDWDTPYGQEQAAQFVAEMKATQPGTAGEWYQIALEHKDSGALLGDCAFHVLAEGVCQAEIGFTLARKYQGQGYATEAVTRLLAYLFDELGLHRVSANCDAKNLASSRLLEKVGMRREAHFVENIWFKGAWGSEYAYGLLRREWMGRAPTPHKTR